MWLHCVIMEGGIFCCNFIDVGLFVFLYVVKGKEKGNEKGKGEKRRGSRD